MKFTCDHCQRLYAIPDDRIRGKTVKVRCKNCQRVITVTWKESAAEVSPSDEQTRSVSLNELMSLQGNPQAGRTWESEPTRALPGPEPGVPWFVLVQGTQEGPLSVAQLTERIRRDEVTLRTYVWRQGRKEWQRASDVAELIPLFAGSPTREPTPVKRRSESGRRLIEPTTAPPSPSVPPIALNEKASDGRALEALFSDLNEGKIKKKDKPREPPPEAAPLVLKRKRPVEEASRSAASDQASLRHTERESPIVEAPASAAPVAEPRLQEPPAMQRRAAVPIQPPPSPAEDLDTGSILPEISADPFAAFSEGDGIEPPAIGEATAFFIAQAGVNRRNPPWKIAAVVLAFLAVPVGGLYVLSRFHGPVQVTQRDASGNEVTRSVSVFSPAGVSGLKDLLMGKNDKPAPPAVSAPTRRNVRRNVANVALSDASSSTPALPGEETARSPGSTSSPSFDNGSVGGLADTRRRHDGMDKQDVSLPDTHGAARAAAASETDGSGGPPPQELKRVVEQTQPAFQFCIEQYVRKHPTFRGGRVNLVATVGASGVVKKSSLDRADIEGSELGACLKTKARRMVFSAFAGDDVDLQIPLILTMSL